MALEPRIDDWDLHWDRYAASASLNPAQRMRHDAVLRVLRALPRPIPRLLDAGSGQGDFLAAARRAGIAREYAGFELSASGVRIAAAKLPQARFVRADMLAPPDELREFAGWAGAAVCSDVIEHVDEPVAFLRALRTYLADGATLVLTVPGGPMSAFDRHIGHRRHYTRALARDVLVEAGYRVDAVRTIGFPFFNLYRLVVIWRGARLVEDVEGEANSASGPLARAVMRAFDLLFRLNLDGIPLGWQVVAVARKAAP